MEAYTRISLPVNKLDVSSPEGDDNKNIVSSDMNPRGQYIHQQRYKLDG
jgi:hypothetical protein